MSGKITPETVYDVVARIPEGRVMSYGAVARAAGFPGNARAVGRYLHVNPRPGMIPCHRVVFSDGSLAPAFAFGGEDAQRALLEKESVKFTADGRVNIKECGIDI